MKKSNLELPEAGKFIYETSYLVYDQEPVIFSGHFENNTPGLKYVGIMVDLFDAIDYGGDEGEIVMNYYLCPVSDVVIKDLESRNNTMHRLFTTMPLIWVTHRYSTKDNRWSTVTRNNAKLNSRYYIPKESTLCQN